MGIFGKLFGGSSSRSEDSEEYANRALAPVIALQAQVGELLKSEQFEKMLPLILRQEEILRSLSERNPDVYDLLAKTLASHARLLLKLGRPREALEVVQSAADAASRNDTPDVNETVVGVLQKILNAIPRGTENDKD
jgi:hypothetical protein